MFHVRRAGINQLARDAHALAFFLEFDAVVGSVGGVFLILAERGRGLVDQVDRRIVSRDMFDRGILLDPRQ